jgi:phenylalanine-4-hydroxylase
VKASPLPRHLQKYIVEQDYSRYTPEDHAVWRNILRQLRNFMSSHAHPAYTDGIKKSGIEIDRIPRIDHISENLEKFGWRAVAVSGFIPPAAFMELQSLSYLPIACDMRSLSHLLYTPAPDIVHEAAGHAPILIDPQFAEYLKRYAKISRSAIISSEDLNLYEAIRELSDLKEHPQSKPEDVKAAEERVVSVSKNMSHVSEAALLGRMNWWTAEYGLFGTLDNPKIFGAGLLSSVGESRDYLSEKIKKIPLSIDCVNYSYDITEPQPQLFVTPDFQTLTQVLEQFANTMAFKTGGESALQKAVLSKNVNTVEIDSGLQISGVLSQFRLGRVISGETEIAYLHFTGPVQLAHQGEEIDGHSTRRHAEGFGSPLGLVVGAQKNMSRMSEQDLAHVGINLGETCDLQFNSGVCVKGRVSQVLRGSQGKALVITFQDASVTYQKEILFRPEWGEYDMILGSKVTSVFSGPADRHTYPIDETYVAKTVPPRVATDEQKTKNSLYQLLSDMRAMKVSHDQITLEKISHNLKNIFDIVGAIFTDEWLLHLEIYELAIRYRLEKQISLSLEALHGIKNNNHDFTNMIDDGIKIAAQS